MLLCVNLDLCLTSQFVRHSSVMEKREYAPKNIVLLETIGYDIIEAVPGPRSVMLLALSFAGFIVQLRK